jgi:hypothetical protein
MRAAFYVVQEQGWLLDTAAMYQPRPPPPLIDYKQPPPFLQRNSQPPRYIKETKPDSKPHCFQCGPDSEIFFHIADHFSGFAFTIKVEYFIYSLSFLNFYLSVF